MSTLLSTKLNIPPPRPDLVPRPRLIERLNEGLTRKLTLVSAPAGYGKTTLVSDWITRSKVPVAWLSLDASDNNLARFFGYLIAALQAIHPDIGAEIAPILATDSALPVEFEPLLTVLVNDIAASATDLSTLLPSEVARQGFVLILDDYHVITELEIHQALDFLFDHIPVNMHMIIISRADPSMPLGRLRVQRELTEIREADLRFALDEATAFFNDLMGLGLSSKDVENLEERTEGWVAGLQLAALSLQGRPDQHDQVVAITGSHRHLIDYLIYEVTSRQPEEVRTFLLHTSILKRFNASLCDAVLGEGRKTNGESPSSSVVGLSSPSREVIDKLERDNLFLVPLDDERRWYRYHHLFADFLRQRLRETQPEIIPELYNGASRWYEDQGMVDEAFHHALAGDDVRRAARLLDENVETFILSRAAVNQVIRWADKLAVDVREEFPRLCIYHAWALQFEYQLDAAEVALALAEARLADPEGMPRSFPASQVTSHAAAIRAYIAVHRGEFERGIDLSLAALSGLPGEEAGKKHPAHESLILRGIITLNLGIGYFELGQMDAADRALQSALPLNQQVASRYSALACVQYMMRVDVARGALNRALANGDKGLFWIEEWSKAEGQHRRPARMLAHLRMQMGIVQYERNDLNQAAEYWHKATEYYELAGSWSRVQGYARLVDLHQALADLEAALNYLRKLKRISLTPGLSLPDVPLAALIAERSLLLSRARPDLNDLFYEAVSWAETSGLTAGDEFSYRQEYEYLTLARVLVAQDEAQEATPLLERLIAAADGAGRKGELISYLALQAVAYYRQGKTDRALTYLSRALVLGEREGYVRTLVDFGPPMHDLLQIAARRGVAAREGYVSRLLAAFPVAEGCFAPSPSASPERWEIEGLLEPLTDRELRILRLLSARRSYHEIADELYLSLNTIKWYAKNIYGKLGVHQRDQAASRARELGLL
jgi:LuxR family maltose regulon positive regulatory protein